MTHPQFCVKQKNRRNKKGGIIPPFKFIYVQNLSRLSLFLI